MLNNIGKEILVLMIGVLNQYSMPCSSVWGIEMRCNLDMDRKSSQIYL